MKKPNIDTQSKRMMVETDTYSEMIDVLMDLRGYLAICLKNFEKEELYESVKYTEKQLVDVEVALKKAGVELYD